MDELAQNRLLHSLLNELKLMDQKQILVCSFTGQRTYSSKEMTMTERSLMIRHLQSIKGSTPKSQLAPAKPAQMSDVEKEQMNVMRRKIFSLCRSMGYIWGDSPDDRRINQFVVYGLVERKGKYKKPMNKLSYKELTDTVSQFQSMLKNNDKTAARREVEALKRELNII